MAVRRSTLAGAFLVATLVLASCGDGATDPSSAEYMIEVEAGDGQLGGIDGQPPDPLEARVTDAQTGEPVEDVYVSWRVIEGAGASVLTATTGTDSTGVARTHVRLGPDTGVYRVAAATNRLFGRHAAFSLRAVLAPRIDTLEPATAAPGDTVTITGEHFGPDAAGNIVLFGGFPGRVVSGGPTEIRAIVPGCLPNRSIDVTVQREAVVGAAASLSVEGESDPPVTMAVGEVRRFDAGALDCTRLAGHSEAAAYLLVAQNAAASPVRPMPFRLVGLTGTSPGGPLAPASMTAPGPIGDAPPPVAWEARIREREERIATSTLVRPGPGPHAADRRLAAAPSIGDRDTFSVLNKDEEFSTVVAEVKHVGGHAVLYEDVDAPEPGLSDADFESFGDLFDDLIHPTDVGVFGEPSDIDGNGRIVVLFTPVVNELTDRDRADQGYVAGFFYGYDLTDGEDSNRAEIFYSLVPDPDAEFSAERSVDQVLRVVPSVLAHELQHMISFNQRRLQEGGGQDELWLSEALAHMAEDLVADTLFARGDSARGLYFVIDNLFRAHRYMQDPSATALIQDEGLGSLEMRGAAWLVLKYVIGHHGGVDLLRRLTQTSRTGVANITAETGESWPDLFHRFAVALWADDAQARRNAPVDAAFTYPDFDLREEIEFWFERVNFNAGGPVAVAPTVHDYADLSASGALSSSSARYLRIEADDGAVPSLGLALTGVDGRPLAAGALPQLTVLRYR